MNIPSTQEQLSKDQQRVFEAAESLNALLAGSAPADPNALAQARWRFASALMQHLALKERYVYSKLESDQRSEVKTFNTKQKSELLQFFSEYNEHMKDWATSRALTEWTSYRLKAISVVQKFVKRLGWEDVVLFDFVHRFAIDISTPSPVTSNWIRNAFLIKDNVDQR